MDDIGLGCSSNIQPRRALRSADCEDTRATARVPGARGGATLENIYPSILRDVDSDLKLRNNVTRHRTGGRREGEGEGEGARRV